MRSKCTVGTVGAQRVHGAAGYNYTGFEDAAQHDDSPRVLQLREQSGAPRGRHVAECQAGQGSLW